MRYVHINERLAESNGLSVQEHLCRTYKEIGLELSISPKTAENHVRNILGKLHLSRRSDLVRYAVEHGLD